MIHDLVINMSRDSPTSYNDIVQLIENNEPGVAANMINDEFVPKQDILELCDRWEDNRDEYDHETAMAIDRMIGNLKALST